MAVLALTGSLDADRDVLGGKAWSITEMLRHDIPVPPAFCLTTDECNRYYEAGQEIPADVLDALPDAVARLEAETGGSFGGGERPLLVSVRSGAPTSMPGMMDTILNLGMTDDVEAALAKATGDADYAADTRRRFLEQFESVVGEPPPAQPWDQLKRAISAVFDSWKSDRAIAYRKERGYAEQGGTAVTVQAMVFGNLDDRSGTGVLFSRDPVTGGGEPFGEWLPRGQGEDVVSGSRDPLPLDAMSQSLPEAHRQLLAAAKRLDEAAGVAQDIEYTVESGTLWLLQCRKAKTGAAGPSIDAASREGAQLLASGRPACAGLVSGVVVCDVEDAEARALDGEDVILAMPTTTPHHVAAMAVVRGILTEIGGATSHAAVVSRELSVPCIVGCGADTVTALAGRTVTIDATKGEVLDGVLPATEAG